MASPLSTAEATCATGTSLALSFGAARLKSCWNNSSPNGWRPSATRKTCANIESAESTQTPHNKSRHSSPAREPLLRLTALEKPRL